MPAKKKTVARRTPAAGKPVRNTPRARKETAMKHTAELKTAPMTYTPPLRTITQAERQRMIEESAYFRAEKAGFTGSPDEHWSAAEREIDARLSRESVRVV